MLPPRAKIVRWPCRAASMSEAKPRARRLRHTGDEFRWNGSFLFPGVLKSLQIFEGDRPGLDQIGDKEARGSAKQIEEISNQPASVLTSVDCRLEELGVADFFYFAQCAFFLEPVNERLNRRVSNALLLGQTLEDLADRRSSQFPVLLQDSCLGLRAMRCFQSYYITRRCYYTSRCRT